MSIIKRLCVAAIAAAASILPVGAEVQPGTSSLLETVDEHGIMVTINPTSCATNGSNGQYRWIGFQREIVLCPGDIVDANDHNTVRHEVIHAIQHCVNVARGTSTNESIIQDSQELADFVLTHLTERQVQWIMDNYDESQWLTEFEAFAGANAYTSSELEEIFLDACTIQQSFDG